MANFRLTRHGRAALAAATLAGAIAGGVSLQAVAQTAVPLSGVPAPPADVTAGKAYDVLERHCARCHQSAPGRDGAAAGGIANILALDELARDPALVRPSLPDASQIYSVLVTWETHGDAFAQPPAAAPPAAPLVIERPTPADLRAVRDWIDALPKPADRACRSGRTPTTPLVANALMAGVLAAQDGPSARDTRFLSLAAPYATCLTTADLAGLRAGVDQLAEILARHGARPGPLQPVDPEHTLYRLSLSSLGWNAAEWDALAASYPLQAVPQLAAAALVVDLAGTSIPLVAADWLADLVVRSPQLGSREARARLSSSAAATVSGAPAKAPVDLKVWGLPPLEALALSWRRPADRERVAADLGLEASELLRQLAARDGAISIAGRQLLHGVAQRDDVLSLIGDLYPEARTAVLAGTDSSPQIKSPASTPPASIQGSPQPVATARPAPQIALWANASTYTLGETAILSVQSTQDCYITLIDVDRSGRATVLFPNEFEPSNLLAAGQVLQVPAAGAHYRFRLNTAGRETIVAICTRTRKAPPGVIHDFERLRFTVLGDWQIFLHERPELTESRRDDAATDIPRPLAARRRPKPKDEKAEQQAVIHDVQARTAITFDVQ